jgi:DNA-binding GntR family transcriptional regulator
MGDDGYPGARLQRPSNGDQVAEHLRGLIFQGRLQQGDHVRQDEIAAELGVSRIPVREALIALEAEGWISIEPHRGAFVQGLDERTIVDHYALIGTLYGLVARRAAERADADGLDRLAELQRQAAAARDVDEFYRRNDLFLRQMFNLADSTRLKAVSRQLGNLVPGNFFAEVAGSRTAQKKALADIARALRERDGEAAAARFGELMDRHGAAVVKLWRKQAAARVPA